MIEPNDRVAEARQDAFRESRRHTPAHDVMGEGRLGGEQQRKAKGEPGNSTVHDAFLPNAELSPAASA